MNFDMLIKILFMAVFFAVTIYIGFYCRKKALNSNDFVLGTQIGNPRLLNFRDESIYIFL